MTWLFSVLRLVAPALIAWGASDKTDVIVNAVPEGIKAKVPAWAWPIIIIFALGAIVFFLLKALAGKKRGKMFALFLLGAGCAALDYFFGNGSGNMVLGTALVTLTTGAAVVTNANEQFLPERIWFAAATQLSGIKITVQGDGVVMDLDANGITHSGLNRVIGQVTNGYVLTLANGLITGKNVLFEFTNSAAQTPVIYYDSDSKPPTGVPMILQAGKLPVLVGGTTIENFATLSLPSLAAADVLTIQYQDGTIQSNMTRVDLQYRLGFTQSIVNTPIYQIDNYNGDIKSVNLNVATAQTAYVQRWVPSIPGGAISSAL